MDNHEKTRKTAKYFLIGSFFSISLVSCATREPADPKELIPTGQYLTSEEYRFRLTVPATMQVDEESSDSWTVSYRGFEGRPVMRVQAIDGFWDPPTRTKIGTDSINGRPATIYQTSDGQRMTVISSDYPLVFTGDSRTFDSILSTIEYQW
ncbi:MAG: hypothetical protein AAGA58_10125 [Verrucomicrobiota bacterium]